MRPALPCAAALLGLLLAGCGFYRVNPPLAPADFNPKHGYRFGNLTPPPAANSDKNFIVLTMSGGGTRAAALAFGAAEEMNRAQLDAKGTTLLDEVDVISSVSGGSFTAAYLGLFGKDQFLQSFQDKMLELPIEDALALRVAAPWNWPDMFLYGRSDLAEKYYGEHIFAGRTFAQMRQHQPYIILNATDLTAGATFNFTQDDFDRICSDLQPIPVARAVLASSAFPVAFTPITLKNYGSDECGYHPPGWVAAALHDFQLNPTRYNRAKILSSYADASARPYIHLSDGGIADNIGLRGPAIALTSTDSPWSILDNRKIQRVAVIVIDSKTPGDASIDDSPRRPSFTTVLEASASNPIANYSFDTVELLRNFIKDQRSAQLDFEVRKKDCANMSLKLCQGSTDHTCQSVNEKQCDNTFYANDNDRPPIPKYYEIHVQFDAITDPQERAKLEAIPTALQLPDDDIELLKKASGEILQQSTAYQQLIADLKADAESGPNSPR